MNYRHLAFGLPALLATCGAPQSCAPTPAPPPVVTDASSSAAIEIGRSVEGRPIMAERFGDGPNVVLAVGQIHGNETGTLIASDVMTRFPWDGSTTVWVIHTLNPDGVARAEANGYHDGRKNAQYIDLNRDGVLQHAVETRVLDNFINVYQPKLILHFHTPNDEAGYFGGTLAANIAREYTDRVDINYMGQVANHDFLWVRHRYGQTVLAEFPAVNDWEAPSGDPRHQNTPEHVEWMAWVLAETVDAWL